jgi:hypothetical protein
MSYYNESNNQSTNFDYYAYEAQTFGYAPSPYDPKSPTYWQNHSYTSSQSYSSPSCTVTCTGSAMNRTGDGYYNPHKPYG